MEGVIVSPKYQFFAPAIEDVDELLAPTIEKA